VAWRSVNDTSDGAQEYGPGLVVKDYYHRSAGQIAGVLLVTASAIQDKSMRREFNKN